jgi:hypothetical protein
VRAVRQDEAKDGALPEVPPRDVLQRRVPARSVARAQSRMQGYTGEHWGLKDEGMLLIPFVFFRRILRVRRPLSFQLFAQLGGTDTSEAPSDLHPPCAC